MNWLKNKIRKWLGISNLEIDTKNLEISINSSKMRLNNLDALYADLVSIGIDVHFKSPHMILIYSNLKGGQLRHIEASFETLQELNDLVKFLKEKYKTKEITWDMPPHTSRFF